MSQDQQFRPRIAVLSRFSRSASAVRYEALVAARRLLEAIWLAGGEPLQLLPAQGAGAEDWHRRLQHVDGVLLPGGGDLNPSTYGQAVEHESVYDVDDLQDSQDLSLANFVMSSGLPFLAICRGMHVVNVASGGSLYQHIEPMHRHHIHDVTFDRSWDTFGLSTPNVTASCFHHQAVDRIGAGWQAAAYSSDHRIEAMVHDSANGVAVQWHPEDTALTDPAQMAIFRSLISRASQR